MNPETAIKLPSELIRYPKSHALYWKEDGRLFTQRGSIDYCCRFSHHGQRGFFDLNTANKSEAQKRAAERYRYVVANGWDKAEKNPAFRSQPREIKQQSLTVGAWISEVRAIVRVRPITLLSYEQALRRLAAEAVLSLAHSNKLHEKWVHRVDEVPLSALSGNVLAKWIKKRLEKVVGDPKATEKATHTINHILRSAKALFSPRRVLPSVGRVTRELLPAPIPLSDVRLLEEDSSARFTPSIKPEDLIAKAHKELGAARLPSESIETFELREQQWIAFLLSFCAGLRKKESDLLTWQQVHLNHADGPRIQLDVTVYFSPKNKAHAKAIPIEMEVAGILQDYRRKFSNEEFVLRSNRKVNAKGLGKSRCHATWVKLKGWLYKAGISDAKPIHSLRKSVGALMAKKHGIHAAQRLLRHTTPLITSRYYTDSEARETPGIGALLSPRPDR